MLHEIDLEVGSVLDREMDINVSPRFRVNVSDVPKWPD